MSDPTATDASSTASSTPSPTSSPLTSASASPLQIIGAGLSSPTFIIPVLIFSLTVIGLIVFAILYNCTSRARADTRRRYIEYHGTSSKDWQPEIHVPEKFRAARQEQAMMYRYS